MAGQGSKSDPAEVAQLGYEALMSGDDKVIAGGKHKIMGGMMNMMTEEAAASMALMQMEPAEKQEDASRGNLDGLFFWKLVLVVGHK